MEIAAKKTAASDLADAAVETLGALYPKPDEAPLLQDSPELYLLKTETI
jgi:hypothetical protein